MSPGFDLDQIRLDKWLVYARFCKTRSQAVKFIASGVRINGRKIEKPDAKLNIGDVLTLFIGQDVKLVEVIALADRRASPQCAQTFYEILPETAQKLE